MGGATVESGSEEDDYMSMIIAEPDKKPESSMQRRKRKEREGEERGRVKSKKEIEAEAAARRDEALTTALPETSKGFKMMAKLGFKPGQKLGATENPHAITEPIGVDVKDDRGGIGMDSEKKRKVREAMEGEAKRVKAEEGDFRDRVAREREEKRMEGQLRGAMNVAEKLDTEAEAEEAGADVAAPTATFQDKEIKESNRSSIRKPNVLWRTLPRERAEKERERRMRFDLQQSLSRNVNYNDPEEDKHDQQALGKEEVELDVEDPELDAFNALPLAERLEKLVLYLRENYNYCFWCKYRYPDQEMEGCPGITEEDHD